MLDIILQLIRFTVGSSIMLTLGSVYFVNN